MQSKATSAAVGQRPKKTRDGGASAYEIQQTLTRPLLPSSAPPPKQEKKKKMCAHYQIS